MNNLIIQVFAAVALCLALPSCEHSKEQQLIGQWQYAAWSMAGETIDVNSLGNPVIDFKEGGVYMIKAGFQENMEKWHVDKDTLVFEQKDGNHQKHLIKKFANDTMVLSGITGDWPTELVLVRVNE